MNHRSAPRRIRAMGWPTAILSLAALLASPSAAWAACACIGMTVQHATGATVTTCSAFDQTFPECTKQKPGVNPACPSTYAYTCPVGVNNKKDLEQQTGFGVQTALTGSSDQCTSGQALQLTITSNQSVSKPDVHETPKGDVTIGGFSARLLSKPPTAPMPDVGTMTPAPGSVPSFGADSYTDPNAKDLLIERTATAIKWWDNTDQSLDDKSEKATWSYRFASFVRGTAGQQSCACVFDINVDWMGAKPVTTMSRVDAQSSHCTF